jgi:predicted ester cyclase
MPHIARSPEQLKMSARRLAEEVLNQGDLAVAAELIAPECIGHSDRADAARGVAGVTARLRLMRRAFPDLHVIVEEQIAEGDWVVQRVSARGTHDGTFLDLAPSGRTATFDLIELNRAGPDGRFVEHRSSLDLFDVLKQLGVLPTDRPDTRSGAKRKERRHAQ